MAEVLYWTDPSLFFQFEHEWQLGSSSYLLGPKVLGEEVEEMCLQISEVLPNLHNPAYAGLGSSRIFDLSGNRPDCQVIVQTVFKILRLCICGNSPVTKKPEYLMSLLSPSCCLASFLKNNLTIEE